VHASDSTARSADKARRSDTVERRTGRTPAVEAATAALARVQRCIGNDGVQRIFPVVAPARLQRCGPEPCDCAPGERLAANADGGLTISDPGDHAEREAERVADQVARAISAEEAGPVEVHGARPPVARSVDPGAASRVAPQTVLAGLGPGLPLPEGERQVFERRFDRDLSAVRVHTDGAAGELAHRIGARAFTAGTDIVFAAGQYRPGVGDGCLLLAHELTHVLQQADGSGWSGVAGSGHAHPRRARRSLRRSPR
jgi:hypothetical protein